MPVFNLELQFDDKGSLQAVKQIDNITGAANGATRAIDNLGNSSSRNGQALSQMGDKGSRAADAIGSAMKKAAGQVLALVGAFTAVSKAMDFMNRGLEFNAQLEQSQIGITSLITSMVKLQDAQGNLLDGQEKYNAAQEISRGLMEKIQLLGLKTSADSQSIVEGFQAILAPALQAGMALEKIPEFAIAGAQALQTMGLPLNQMKFELESLLSGNVNLAQDVLAPRLFADVQGNLKEYIQSLKQAGKLEEEIFRRLEPYNLALKDTENTWAAISGNLGEALDKLAGDTSLNYTKAMKQSLKDINDLIINSDTGKISKDFEQIASVLADIQDWIGNKIVASTQTLISYTKEINSFLGSDLGQGTLSALTTALKLAAGALAGFAAARIAAFSNNKVVTAINASKEAVNGYKQSVIAAAQAQRDAIQAQLAQAQAYRKTGEGLREFTSSAQARAAMLAREIQLTDQLRAANQRLTAAQNMSTVKSTLTASLKGLVNLMGGPLNAAFITAGVAMGTLASMQSKAEKAADLHSNALKTLNELTEEASKNGLTLANTLGSIAEARRKLAIESENEAISKLKDALSGLDFNYVELDLESGMFGQFEDLGTWLKDISQEFVTGKKSSEEYGQALNWALDKIGDQAPKLKEKIVKALDFAEAIQKSNENIDRLSGKIVEASEKADKNISVVQESASAYDELKKAIDALNGPEKENVNTVEGAIKWLEKRNAQTEEGKQKQIEMARAVDENALATLRLRAAELEAKASMGVFMAISGQATERQIADTNAKLEMLAKVKNMISEYQTQAPKFDAPKSGGGGGRKKSGGGGGKSTDPAEAAKKWDELNSKLAQLEGRSTGAAESLNKTLKEIEDTGKAAKKSASDIDALKQAFVEATDTKTIKELNKELLQLEGNTRAVQEIENQEKIDQFRAKLADIRGMSQEEKDILMGRYQVAVQTQVKVDDLQSAVDFLKDLESLGGDYGIAIQKQNELIEYQASLYREKLPADMQPYIDQWEKLKLLGNDTSFMGGLERAVRKFGSDYTDLATTVENFTTQMGSTIGNTLSDAFMKGKFAAEDFFSSIISMAAQAASNYFIGMIFQGIGGFFGGGSTFSAGQSATMSANGMQSGFGGWLTGVHGHAKGDVFSGGNIGQFSGRVVKGPTLFNFDRQITPFARGAGVMGEAGAEAILPLARMSNGDLGVQFKVDALNLGWQSQTANYAKIISELQSQMRSERQYDNQAPKISINISNQNPTADVQAGQMTPDGNGGFNMEIVISQIEQRIVGRMKQGKSQIAQYQEQAYGMSRASVIARGRGRN